MASTKDAVQFYWDPVCPWCWITSRWMEDVGRQKAIDVDWRFFSLRKINEGRDLPERFRVSHLQGLRALRVAAAVREQHGREAVRKLYTAMGTRKHHDQADIGTVAELESILHTCGLPTALAAAADDLFGRDAVNFFRPRPHEFDAAAGHDEGLESVRTQVSEQFEHGLIHHLGVEFSGLRMTRGRDPVPHNRRKLLRRRPGVRGIDQRTVGMGDDARLAAGPRRINVARRRERE